MKINKLIIPAVFLAGALFINTYTNIPSASAEEYITENGLTFRVFDGYAELNKCDSSVSGEITVPAEINNMPVRSIGVQAFEHCGNITSVSIPEEITNIGAMAFLGCSSLVSIDIPDSVTNIMQMTFFGCTELSSANIPDSIKSIGQNAFSDCRSLTSVTIPESVQSIGSCAFADCTNLNEITVMNPDCVIYDFGNTICNKNNIFEGVIYGYQNSTAQAYAEKYGYKFESINEFSVGDINGDNSVNSSDASDVLAIYSELSTKGKSEKFTPQQVKAADVNRDGKVNSADSSLILEYYTFSSTSGTETFEEFLEKKLNNK